MTEISAFVNWVGIFSFTQFINYIIVHRSTSRRNGRVVEGTGLENRRGFTPSVSSNLTSSAINIDEQIIAPLIVKSVAFLYVLIQKELISKRLRLNRKIQTKARTHLLLFRG